MNKYTFVCNQGHEPVTMETEAANDDEALGKLRDMAKAHLSAVHQGMSMSDEEVDNMIKGGWTKAQA